MFRFGRKETGVDPLTAEEARLKARFAQAVFGTGFRTLTFAADSGMDKPEWLEAIKVPGDGWRVIRKAQFPALSGAIDQKTETRGLTFYDAADSLTRYEATQRDLGRTPLDEMETATLGERYLRTFAEREGLVFDTEGIIHPTLDGQILADGLFPPDAYAKAAQAWTAKTKAQPAAPVEIGQFVSGKGVFVGLWSPKDRSGTGLNKTFNLYAAPYDLGLDENGQGSKLVVKFVVAVTAVGKITNLMGFAGFKGMNDTDLYNALRDGSYKGEWFMPTKDILHGQIDGTGNEVQNDHLFGHRNTGVLANTFTTVNSGSDLAHCYWSCTEPRDYPSFVWFVSFSDGGVSRYSKDNYALSSRPVRAELRP